LDTISVGLGKEVSLSTVLDDVNDKNLEYTNSVVFIRHYQAEKVGEQRPPGTDFENAQAFWPKDHTREHTDSGILTLKPLSEIAALQLYRWSDRQWINAELPSGKTGKTTMIVLVGEELAYLTNGYFKAAIHRVAFQHKESRISLPFQLRGDRSKFDVPAGKQNTSLKMIGMTFSVQG